MLNSIKHSLFGSIYIRYLKRFPFVRALVIRCWVISLPILFRIYAQLNSIKPIKLPLIKISNCSLSRQLIIPSHLVVTPFPQVFPGEKRRVLNFQSGYEFPEIFITTISNCTTTGASNFLDINEAVICHDLFRPSHDYSSEELQGRLIIDSKKSTVVKFENDEVVTEIESGAVFTDALSNNYAHFLTEILPRVFVFIRQLSIAEATVIIDFGLHQNLMEALEIVIDENVSVIGLDQGKSLLVKSLQVVSPCGYIPFDRRPKTKHLADHSHGVFSSIVLLGMRDYIKSKIIHTNEVVQHKKIFIRRNSSYRNVSNSKNVEDILVANGFFVIEPENLSFREQVILFNNADVIVGATGAALANLIFCSAETKVIILISDFKQMIYGYWQNMASSVGNKVTYVIGECTDATPELHSNFQINTSDLLDAISE
jgi:hypothetical protein